MHLIKLLNSWREISSIISITRINNRQEYKKTIDRFKVLLNDFKESSQETILNPTTANEEDQKETFYFHVLQNYMLPIMIQTFETFNMGLGIYSMQGIERRNKESKNIAKRFSNNRYNLCFSTMQRLFDLFFFGKDYMKVKN